MTEDTKELIEGSEMTVVDRYADLMPAVTNGAVALERAMETYAKKEGKTFVQAYVDLAQDASRGDLEGNLGPMTVILNKLVPDLKSTEFRVKGMTDDERTQAAKELSRSIID